MGRTDIPISFPPAATRVIFCSFMQDFASIRVIHYLARIVQSIIDTNARQLR